MIIKDIHYGLTLLYSYHLPLFEIEETGNGFLFRKTRGSPIGMECVFDEKTMETTCKLPRGFENNLNMLGLDKLHLFREICRVIRKQRCIAENITLIHNALDRQLVFYTIFLSRNTDYYVNSVEWMRELLERGAISSNSYIVRDFIAKKNAIDKIYTGPIDRSREIMELLAIKGVGIKSIKAYLLHAYGDTVHAPVDRYYARFLGLNTRISVSNKNKCISLGLNCGKCRFTCPYMLSTKRFSVLNGVVQSLVYIYNRLMNRRRSHLEEILVRDPSVYLDELEHLVKNLETLRYPCTTSRGK